MAKFRLSGIGSTLVCAGITITLTMISFGLPTTVHAVNIDAINRSEVDVPEGIPPELEVAIKEVKHQKGYLNEAGPLFLQKIASKEQPLKEEITKLPSEHQPGNQAEPRVRRVASESTGSGCRGDTCNERISATAGGGTIYTRWGKDDCPSTSELVYAGVVGGPSCSQKGGGGGYLCLPDDPEFDQPVYSQQTGWGRAHITNAEFKVSAFPPFNGKQRGNVACAVCMVTQRSIKMTYPARNECPDDDWTHEYHGYLMTAPDLSYRSDWICVDREAEVVSTNPSNQGWGAALVPVEAACRTTSGSSLPCSSYTNGYELTCAVCTR